MVTLRDLRGPEELKDISHAEARALCAEIRREIVDTVASTGGHLGSSLGSRSRHPAPPSRQRNQDIGPGRRGIARRRNGASELG